MYIHCDPVWIYQRPLGRQSLNWYYDEVTGTLIFRSIDWFSIEIRSQYRLSE
jgi:hypothetical protein